MCPIIRGTLMAITQMLHWPHVHPSVPCCHSYSHRTMTWYGWQWHDAMPYTRAKTHNAGSASISSEISQYKWHMSYVEEVVKAVMLREVIIGVGSTCKASQQPPRPIIFSRDLLHSLPCLAPTESHQRSFVTAYPMLRLIECRHKLEWFYYAYQWVFGIGDYA